MKKTAFLAIIVLSLAASVAYAGAVSCGPEQSSGSSGYPDEYYSQTGCHGVLTTVYAYKNCIDQFGNACTITWDENYIVHYTQTFDPPGYTCDAASSSWSSNTNIVDPCQ
ncbi:MAG TPA: hypothetical protein VLX28_10215 [Thermoanaerobaculia bacterium]|nr:hypothetical protein [Thermoanaerobaculia bacterium]